MATGDFVVFEEVAATISNLFDLDADTLKIALITVDTVPAADDATPALADYTECTPGGNYSAGGTDINATFAEAGGVAKLDGDDVTWLTDGSNPADARYAVLHDTTVVGAIGFWDLGGTIDLSSVDLTITLPANGILDVNTP